MNFPPFLPFFPFPLRGNVPSVFDAIPRHHRFLLLRIFPRSIPRGNAIRSRTPLSYIFIRSRKRDNAKGRYRKRDGPLADRSIAQEETTSFVFTTIPLQCLVCIANFVRRRWKQATTLVISPLFNEPFFRITILRFAGERKKEKRA